MKDRYWSGTLYLFLNNPKLNRYLTIQYFNLEEGTIQAAALKKLAKPWAESEKFMLNLALHMYNEQHKVNLSDMDHLDFNNKQLVFEALRLRFG
ncbi:hypothetical protein [Paenibacillus periandrae]|uniref:hypothetical protein n=1 Tax=Paenibacillus periandrae TaxID=1761741 RepID=UPI001F08C8D2|nr:hypothetical protein [Paenibacillus periandrae]